jgi:hypothetical protein
VAAGLSLALAGLQDYWCAMARYTAAIAIPAQLEQQAAGGISGALSQALLAMGLEVEQISRLQVAATTGSAPLGVALRLVISWSQPLSPDEPVLATLELLSRETMATGAPLSRAAMEQLLQGLAERIPHQQVFRGGVNSSG